MSSFTDYLNGQFFDLQSDGKLTKLCLQTMKTVDMSGMFAKLVLKQYPKKNIEHIIEQHSVRIL